MTNAPAPTTVTDRDMPDLRDYDVILINSSAGKDSQASLDVVAKIAARAGITDRLVVVHCDLGRVEWAGTRELAEEQAAHYGLRFEVVSRPQGDLLDQVEKRAAQRPDAPAWPSSTTRYCTSDHKRGQVRKLLTKLTDEQREAGITDRPVRILNVMGFRAEESSARAKRVAYEFDSGASNGKRHVDQWLPIHTWDVQTVWARIKASGVRYHEAYDLGMTRLSCQFCVLASKDDLVLSARCNPTMAQEYAALEQRIGWTFTANLSMVDIIAQADALGPVAPATVVDEDAERRARWAANKRASRARLTGV
jgi:3'-phosphoadenosine 5'-phosphosulfate sulfotransferase (PAPS reductase)/FAD synthetase